VQQGKKITKNALEALKKANVEGVEISDAELEGAYAAPTWSTRRRAK